MDFRTKINDYSHVYKLRYKVTQFIKYSHGPLVAELYGRNKALIYDISFKNRYE